MASKPIRTGAPDTASFASSLPEISSVIVAAHGSGSHRSTGRTANALNELKEDARAEGFEAGYADGLRQGLEAGRTAFDEEHRRQFEEFVKALESKSAEFDVAAAQWVQNSEQSLAELAVEIANRILLQEVQLPHDTISKIVKEALSEVRLAEDVRIRIAPFDREILEARRDDFMAAAPHIRRIEFVDDPSLSGGCVIVSDGGAVDSSLPTRLELTLRSIREAA